MCYTKDALLPFMEKMRAEYSAYRKPFSVLVIDIDGFKSFNDKYGHIFGDEALKYFSSSLRLNLDDEDCVIIRFGGDEFVAIFPGRTAGELYRLSIHVEKNIRKRPFLFRGREYKFSFSGGIASCPRDAVETHDIIEKADKAMYFSKRHGSGRITRYDVIHLEFLKWFAKAVIIGLSAAAIIVMAARFFNIDINVVEEWLKNYRF